MAERADDKCGACYKVLREGPTVLGKASGPSIVLCDDCYTDFEKGKDFLPCPPLTIELDYNKGIKFSIDRRW